MRIIETLSKKIKEEICDAKDYIMLAIEYKEEYPDLARTLYNISLQEMDHKNMLHNEVADIIKRYRETNGEPPPDMLAVYEYLHKQQIEKAAEVKTMQAMYKEG